MCNCCKYLACVVKSAVEVVVFVVHISDSHGSVQWHGTKGESRKASECCRDMGTCVCVCVHVKNE